MRYRRPFALFASTILLVAAAQPVGASVNTARERQAVEQFHAAVNSGRLSIVAASLAASATLQVDGRQWRGHRTVVAWWRIQMAHRVTMVFQTSITVHGATAAVIVNRTTHGGDCGRGCVERMTIRFAGEHFQSLVLQRLTAPVPVQPVPSRTVVPPTPPSGPPPRTTPTVPS